MERIIRVRIDTPDERLKIDVHQHNISSHADLHRRMLGIATNGLWQNDTWYPPRTIYKIEMLKYDDEKRFSE